LGAISADGSRVAICTFDVVYFWETESGKLISKMKPSSPVLDQVALANDGSTIVTYGARALVWNADSGRLSRAFNGHDFESARICITADGKYAVTGDRKGKILFWQTETGKVVQTMKDDSLSNDTLAMNDDGSRLVSGSRAGVCVLWNPLTGEELRELEGLTGDVKAVSVDKKGNRVAACDEDRVILWDAESGETLHQFESPETDVSCVALNRSGSRLAISYMKAPAEIRDTTTGNVETVISGVSTHHEMLFTSESGRRACTRTMGRTVFWDPVDGNVLGDFEYDGWPSLINGSRDGNRFLIEVSNPEQTREMELVNVEPRRRWRPWENLNETLGGFRMTSDGKMVVAFGKEQAYFFDTESCKEVGHWKEGYDVSAIHGRSFSADGTQLAAGKCIVKVPQGKVIRTITEPPNSMIHSIVPTANGSQYLLTAMDFSMKDRCRSLPVCRCRRSEGVVLYYPGRLF
jgi:WD40 repeat protein